MKIIKYAGISVVLAMVFSLTQGLDVTRGFKSECNGGRPMNKGNDIIVDKVKEAGGTVGEVEKEKTTRLWGIGFIVALIVAVLYRILFDIIFNPFLDYVSTISSTLDLYLGFGIPGIISFGLFMMYSKNFFKSLIVGITSVLIFILVLFLMPPALPGIP
jgi:hypothetical protein